MPDKAISDLTQAGTITGAELLGVTQEGQSVRTTIAEVMALAGANVEGANWAVPFRGALITRLTAANVNSWPFSVQWGTTVYDTDGFFSSAMPSRIVIPSGVTKVRLRASVRFTSAAQAGTTSISITKNGVQERTTVALGRQGTTGFPENGGDAQTPVIDVTEGDYFEVRCSKNGVDGATQVLATFDTFFAVEVVEVLGAARRPYDKDAFIPGVVPSGLVSQLLITTSCHAAENLGVSQFYLNTPPSADLELEVQHNGVTAGTISFLSGENVGIALFPQTDFMLGDRLSIVAPADTFTAADLSVSVRLGA